MSHKPNPYPSEVHPIEILGLTPAVGEAADEEIVISATLSFCQPKSGRGRKTDVT